MHQVNETSRLLDTDQTFNNEHKQPVPTQHPPSLSLQYSSDSLLSGRELCCYKDGKRWTRSSHTVLLLAVSVVFTSSLGLSMWARRKKGYIHNHTIPTLLSIQTPTLNNENDDTESKFVNAQNSDVYSQLLRAPFEDYDDTLILASEYPTMKVNKESEILAFHESLVLSWENPLGAMGDTSVVALYCPANESDPKKFRDAATVAQIKWTHKQNVKQEVNRHRDRHLETTDNDASMTTTQDEHEENWFITSFPIVREDTCQFRLYQPVQLDGPSSTNTTKESAKPTSLKGTTNYSYNTTSTDFILNATSPTIHIKNGKMSPTTLHLAYTSRPTEMRISFSTGQYPASSKLVAVSIYGKDESSVKNYHRLDDLYNGTVMQATGESITYHANDLCQAPANIEQPGLFLDPGILHSVVMNNLDLDEIYYYKVGMMSLTTEDDDYKNIIVWSSLYSFTSSTAKTSHGVTKNLNTKPFTFLVYGDQGCPGYGWVDGGDRTAKWTSRELTRSSNPIRAVHHFGDLSYAQGSGHMWDHWMDMVSGFAARVPLMVGVGNHEYDHTAGGLRRDLSGVDTDNGFHPKWGNFGEDSSGECGVPASKRFIMPNNGNGIYWYSYDSAGLHTVMLSSEHDLSPGSDQYSWLENDLKSIHKTYTTSTTRPWILVESHRPMYHNEDIPQNTLVGIEMRHEFEYLLQKYEVDLFLSGHYHSYLRTCSGLYQGKCGVQGPVHITVGTAGAALDSVELLKRSWVEYYSAEWGYGKITVHNKTSLHFEFISDQDGVVKDEVWLIK